MSDLKLYAAAVFTGNAMPGMSTYERHMNDVEKDICRNLPHVLESWHYVGKDKYVRHMRENKAQIFLDSGAFSAFNLGVKLSVKEYCDYIKRNQDIIRVEDGILIASVLDGIGDADETWRNQQEMESYGVRPLPCFHAGEDVRYLEHYIANYEYITLGGLVGGTIEQLKIWLDRMWNKHLLDGAGRPKIKVHGFGITSIEMMERYEWHSCDSSTWVQAAAFGEIWDAKYGRMQVSSKSPARHEAGRHLRTFTGIEKATVNARLMSKGFDPDRLADVPYARWAYNLGEYAHICADINQKRNSGAYRLPQVQELF